MSTYTMCFMKYKINILKKVEAKNAISITWVNNNLIAGEIA